MHKLLYNPLVLIFQAIKPKELNWFGVAALAISAIGFADAKRQQKKAKKVAGRVAQESMRLVEMETEEELRRMDLEHEQTSRNLMAELNVRQGASGLASNPDKHRNYFDRLESEFHNQKDWLKLSSAQQIKRIREGGAYQSVLSRSTRNQQMLSYAQFGLQGYQQWKPSTTPTPAATPTFG